MTMDMCAFENEWFLLYFNGGGHKNAAGGKLDMKLPEALTYLKDVVENKLEW